MKVEMRALESIKPYEKNAKKHDQTQIDNVAELEARYCEVLVEKGWCVWQGQKKK